VTQSRRLEDAAVHPRRAEHAFADQGSQRQWLIENRAAIDAWNEHVERQALPLSVFRQF
jgi:post-segregation antitoxin (ccd killing protein)